MAKANTEKMIYQTASENGAFDAMAILPLRHRASYVRKSRPGLELAKLHETDGAGNPYKKTKGGRMSGITWT